MKKKILAMFLSVVLAFGLLTACGEKLTMTVEETVEVTIGEKYEIKTPTFLGVKDTSAVKWTYKISLDTDPKFEGYVDEENKLLINKNGVYTIDYEATFGEQKITAKTTITTKDSTKPTFGSTMTSFTIYKDVEATLPDMGARDNGFFVTVTTEVTKPDGTVVPVTNNKFTPDGSVGHYNIKYTAVDSKNNKEEKTIVAGLRKDKLEVESFDYDYSLAGFSSKFTYESAPEYTTEKVHTEGGKALKMTSKGCKKADGTDGQYLHYATSMAGITDFSNVGAIEMWVYSTQGLYDDQGFNLGVSKEKAGEYTFSKNIEPNVWTKVSFTQGQLKKLYNGDATQGRQPINNVTEFTFFVDFYGQSYNDFTVYVDDVVIIPLNANWEPVKYSTETHDIYEINNFDDIDRFFAADTSRTDSSATFELNEDPAYIKIRDDQENKGSLKMSATYKSGFYPNFLSDLTKTLKILGKKLSELPDTAAIKYDIYFVGDRLSGGENVIEGCPYSFLNSDGNILGKEKGTYQWIYCETWGEGGYTIKDIKDAIGKNSIDDVIRLESFMYCDADWESGTYLTVYFDNFRLEVPKA